MVKLANLSKTKIQYSVELFFFLGIFVFRNKDFESGTNREEFFLLQNFLFFKDSQKLGVKFAPLGIFIKILILILGNIVNYKITFSFLALSDVFAFVKMFFKKIWVLSLADSF